MSRPKKVYQKTPTISIAAMAISEQPFATATVHKTIKGIVISGI
jgi:hypothetical protein